ncbi:MAG: hypothetical protein OXU67_00680 [Chloroflexota bacterium]|nr:hypothetical protein [Chloroflexota bacterium]
MAVETAEVATPPAATRRPERGTGKRRLRIARVRYGTIVAGSAVFLLGGYWDVSWHIIVGRDTFWSPPHLVLYAGIIAILAACGSAVAQAAAAARGRGPALPGPLVPLPFGLRLPPGILVTLVGAGMSLASAPIDDTWHRLYGLDVTVWSPPHIMLVAGMVIAPFGALIGLTLETNHQLPVRLRRMWHDTGQLWRLPRSEITAIAAGGMILAIALAVLTEYDFDLPIYGLVYHPIILSSLSAFILVAAARASGRIGAATLAALAYTAMRLAAHAELVLLDGIRPQIPLVLAAAPIIDLVLVGLPLRPLWLRAALAGAGFAGALVAVQLPYLQAYGWVQWEPEMLAVAAPWMLGLSAAGAALGWLVGSTLRPVHEVPEDLASDA